MHDGTAELVAVLVRRAFISLGPVWASGVPTLDWTVVVGEGIGTVALLAWLLRQPFMKNGHRFCMALAMGGGLALPLPLNAGSNLVPVAVRRIGHP